MCSKLYFCVHKYPSDIRTQKFTCQQSWNNTRNSYYIYYGKKNIPVQGEIKGGRVRTLQTKGIWLSVNEWHDP